MQPQPTKKEMADPRKFQKYEKRMARFAAQVEKKGRRWCHKLRNEFQRYPAGIIVAINTETGEYITAKEVGDALKKLDKKYGKERAPHWMVRLAEDEHGKKYDSWVYSL